MPFRHTGCMNLRRLQYFLAVVDAGTVTAASEQLHIAQPALSRQIKTLERELSLPLFEAHGNRLALTQAGRAFVPAARKLMLKTRELEEAAGALRTGRVSSLVIAATNASVRGFVAPFIATIGPDDPLLLTRETSHFGIPDALLHGADFAVSPAAPAAGLDAVHVGSIPVKAYVAAGHPWARDGIREIPLAELCREQAILPSHQSVSRHLVDHALNQGQLRFARVSECDDGQTIMALAAAGHGTGITTDQPMYGAHPLRILVDRPGSSTAREALTLPLHVAWMPGHFAEETIRSMAARIRGFLQGQGIMLPDQEQQE